MLKSLQPIESWPVMAGLVPAIPARIAEPGVWMAATRAAMTILFRSKLR
jgi:hypothetical protein